MDKKYIVVVDKGTTNLKAVAFDFKGNEIFKVTKHCGSPVSLKPGWCEQDMNHIWDITGQALRELCKEKIRPEDIAGVSVTGHGSGIFPIDQEGNPVRRGILSLDTRASCIVEQWEQDGRTDWFLQRMKAEVLPCYPVSLLAWMKEYEPESYKKVHKILFVKDWIKYKLTGAASTDYTDAGPSCLLDVDKMKYAEDVLDKVGIPEMKSALPEIISSYEMAGYVTKAAAGKTGLYEGTPVLSGVHDMMACPFGAGTVEDTQVVSVVGTWGMNFMASKQRTGTFSFPHVIPQYFLTGRLDGNSGSVQDRMLELLCSDNEAQKQGQNIYEYATAMAEKVPKSNLIFQPYLFGGLYDPAACGGFYGVRDWHERADFIKAVYEGIVFGHYANIKTIEGYQKFTTLWLMGGGAKSDYLAQTFADVTGLQVKTALVEEVTARGAALSALVGLGICNTFEEACIPVRVKKEFLPDMENNRFYQKKFYLFEKISQNMKVIWKEMEKVR